MEFSQMKLPKLPKLTDTPIFKPRSYRPKQGVEDIVKNQIALGDLNNVTETSSSTNEGLLYNGSTWVNSNNFSLLDQAQAFTGQKYFSTNTLTDASNISWDLNTAQVATVTLGGNRTLSNPTNMVDGGRYVLRVIQDGTGNRTLSFDSSYQFEGGNIITLSTGSGATDFIFFESDGTSMFCRGSLNYSGATPPTATINESLLFNDDDSSHLNWTPAGAGDRSVFTISVWVKRANLFSSGSNVIFYQGTNNLSSNYAGLFFINNQLSFENWESSYQFQRRTNRLFRDPNAWYHLVAVLNTDHATQSERVKLYVNGIEETSFSNSVNPSVQGYQNNRINTANVHYIGRSSSVSNLFDGYIAEFHFIDGQALDPTSFGEFDSDGNWIPIDYAGTYGSNGFYLDFNNSANLGQDQSGNSNDWTVNNITSADQVSDSPTDNFPTFNPLDSAGTFRDGNLEWYSNSVWRTNRICLLPTSGKWSVQYTVNGSRFSTGSNAAYRFIGVATKEHSFNSGNAPSSTTSGLYGYSDNGWYIENAAQVFDTGSDWFDGDVLELLYDADNNTLDLKKNGTLQTQLTTPNEELFLTIYTFDSSRFGELDCGQKGFTPTTGYQYPSYSNLRTEFGYSVDKPSDYFDVLTYSGSKTTTEGTTGDHDSKTGLDFDPDLVWLKARNEGTFSHLLLDTVRGNDKNIFSNNTGAETAPAALTSGSLVEMTTGGFVVQRGSGSGTPWRNVNESGYNYVAWCWKEDNTKGFDIVSYTGNGAASQNISHSLGQVPELIIVKNRDASWGWFTYHVGTDATAPEDYRIQLDLTNGRTDATQWNDTAPTTTQFSLGNGSTFPEVNGSGVNYIAYLFASVPGLIKVGYYIGNGVSDGPFVYTGFKPRYIMFKRVDSTGWWNILDTERSPRNEVINDMLFAQSSSAEGGSGYNHDILSNGFKIRTNGVDVNATTGRYIYLAIAEDSQLRLAV